MTDTTSTPPTEADSYKVTRFNALRHGVLSRYTVLPWEDEDEYCRLLAAFVAEHKPKGPTEEHLVEEMVGVLWRKRRLRLAEAAAYRQGLKSAVSSDQRTTRAALVHLDIGKETTANTTIELADLDQRESITARALDLLQGGKARAYDKALSALSEDTRERWNELIKRRPGLGLLNFDNEENQYTANADDLVEFLQEEVMPSYETRRKELQNRPLIREQAFLFAGAKTMTRQWAQEVRWRRSWGIRYLVTGVRLQLAQLDFGAVNQLADVTIEFGRRPLPIRLPHHAPPFGPNYPYASNGRRMGRLGDNFLSGTGYAPAFHRNGRFRI